MAKFTDEMIRQWIDADEHFEMRGDGDRLYLAYPTRYKHPVWQFRFWQEGQHHRLRIGRYPEMSIDEARAIAASYRRMVESGESVLAAIANSRAVGNEKALAQTFSAMLREASRHGAKRMTVTVEFEAGGEASWAN